MWTVGRIIDLLGEKIFFPREEKKRWPGLWLWLPNLPCQDNTLYLEEQHFGSLFE